MFGAVTWAESMTAWSTLAYTLATVGLLVAATYAGIQVKGQLGNMRRQLGTMEDQISEMQKTRYASLRPIPVLSSVAEVAPGRFRIVFQNVGVGPARPLRATVWTDTFAAGLSTERFHQELNTRLARIKEGRRVVAEVSGLGVGATHWTDVELPPLSSTGGRGFVVEFEYEDIFARKFKEEAVGYVTRTPVDAEPASGVGSPTPAERSSAPSSPPGASP